MAVSSQNIDLPNLEKMAAKRLEERHLCRTDKFYLSDVMGWQFQKDVHQELFDKFIKFDPGTKENPRTWNEQSAIKDRLILWPRGHFKSTAIHVEIVQIILNFPDITLLIMRGGLNLTRVLLKEIKSYFVPGMQANSRLHEIFPEFCAPILKNLGNQDSFTVPARINKGIAQATVTVLSPGSIKASQHYDAIFFDDLVHEKNFQSKEKLNKIEEDFSSCFPLLNPGGYRYVTGTRYAHGDLYEKLIIANTEDKWIVSVKTCWSDDGLAVRFPEKIVKLRNGQTKTVGFTREFFLNYMKEKPDWYCSQYLNQPASMASQIFTDQLIDESLVQDDRVPPLGPAVLFVDTAFTTGVESDDSVIMCGRVDSQGTVYLTDFVGGQWQLPTASHAVVAMALKHRPVRILIEQTSAGIPFAEYVRLECRNRGVILPLDYIKVDTKANAKETRVRLLAGHMKARRFRILRSLAANERWEVLTSQLKKFPGGRHNHDDYPDTMALMAKEFGAQTLATPVGGNQVTGEITSLQQLLVQNAPAGSMFDMIRQSEAQRQWEEMMEQTRKDEEDGTSPCGSYITS